MSTRAAAILGAFLCAGLLGAGWLLGDSVLQVRDAARVVTVKGLAEREVPADLAVWPIRYATAGNDLAALYADIAAKDAAIVAFLKSAGFEAGEITVTPPSVTDKLAQEYGNGQVAGPRYTARQGVTVYTGKIDPVRAAQGRLGELGRQGIAIGGDEYETQTQYLFSGLNDLKPAMVEEATRKAREVAEQFARDSGSALGKIRTANQGQFSIEDRDTNTPYVKRVRVVSTVEYYLKD